MKLVEENRQTTLQTRRKALIEAGVICSQALPPPLRLKIKRASSQPEPSH